MSISRRHSVPPLRETRRVVIKEHNSFTASNGGTELNNACSGNMATSLALDFTYNQSSPIIFMDFVAFVAVDPF